MSPPARIAVTASVRRTDVGIPRVELEVGYLRAVEAAECAPLIVCPGLDQERLERRFSAAAGLLLTGGEDVDPERYGEAPAGARSLSPERDALELRLFALALERGLPVLAICRGIQLLNVALGGSLYQDLSAQWGTRIDHDRYREFDAEIHGVFVDGIRLLEGVYGDGRTQQNSAHHQGIRILAPALTPVAWADDGLVEAVELRDHGAPWVVGVQWHPERRLDETSGSQRRLFRRFAEAVLGVGASV